MSGGKFDYRDQSAKWAVEESLGEDIERYKDDDSFEGDQIHRNALLLKSASDVLFKWLHDYDWAASSDTSFDTLDKQVNAHIMNLQNLISAVKTN